MSDQRIPICSLSLHISGFIEIHVKSVHMPGGVIGPHDIRVYVR